MSARALLLALGIAMACPAMGQSPRVEPSAPAVPAVPAPVLPGGQPLAAPAPQTQDAAPPSVPLAPATPDLVVDLSLARVSITSAFQGASLLLFGMYDPPGEIVVVVQGPPARETVLRKERVAGLWLNVGRQRFDDVPAYYAIAASQPLQRLLARGAGGEILSLEDRLATVKPLGDRNPASLAQYRAGLVEVKRRDGLYPAAIGQVSIQANRLFRADLPFPSSLPEGVYEVRTYLLREGRIVAAIQRPLPVGKVGFNAQIEQWADRHGAWYGLAAIVMALAAGWLGGAIVRRL
ncbi:MAG: hypothetical protein FJX02_00110 [Alphaproteobacteria bacterium]|nr:hypothetical protein [Alphaproteobacteria bacterium]